MRMPKPRARRATASPMRPSPTIPVGYAPGAVTEATADFAIALMLAGSRRIYEGARFVRSRGAASSSSMSTSST